MSVSRFCVAAALAVAGFASPARADVLLTPFIGGNFGGSASTPLADFVGDQSHVTFGGSTGAMAGGVFGFEAELGYTPDFFGTDVGIGALPDDIVSNNVLTVMGNVLVGIPIEGRSGGVRPYAVGGVGLIRQRFEVAGGLLGFDENDAGFNVGGGVMAFFGPNVGIRGDIRHFRSFSAGDFIDILDLDLGTFNFTRATVGVVFRY